MSAAAVLSAPSTSFRGGPMQVAERPAAPRQPAATMDLEAPVGPPIAPPIRQCHAGLRLQARHERWGQGLHRSADGVEGGGLAGADGSSVPGGVVCGRGGLGSGWEGLGGSPGLGLRSHPACSVAAPMATTLTSRQPIARRKADGTFIAGRQGSRKMAPASGKPRARGGRPTQKAGRVAAGRPAWSGGGRTRPRSPGDDRPPAPSR
jgi:hypothetical protein